METNADAVSLLAGLTADELQTRLDTLEAERRALTALLRSVRARDRYRQPTRPADSASEGAAHA